jgi:predicted enzyme related to lactoylglutathione lyase
MVHLVEHKDAPSMPSHHGAFEVDDIDAAFAHIRGRGVETSEIATRGDGQREFKFDDTEGNRIEICTKSGFGILV